MNETTYSLSESFYEQVSEWCCENEVEYEDSTVSIFTSDLTEELFEVRFNECCKTLRTLNYQPEFLG